ncbi:MAG TPA: TetR/AcrR family transcriptional regulator [Xanthobacteraceae bacterium]|nr:TetR/AcrR family transcriptional regulator [Xanthobacteraceae bacterium]
MQRKRARKYREILHTAAEVLTERGYSATSLDEIAERLDVAKATIYHYFDSKDALISACVKQPSLEAMARLEAVAARYDHPAKRLEALVRENLILVVIDCREISGVVMRPFELPEPLRSEYRSLRVRHDRLFRETIQEGIDSGVFDPSNPVAARHCMYGAMNHAGIWIRGTPAQMRRTIDGLADSIMRMFLRSKRSR